MAVNVNWHPEGDVKVKAEVDTGGEPYVALSAYAGEVVLWLPSVAALEKLHADLGAALAALQAKTHETTYTDAPVDYDGFGTRTAEPNVGRAGRNVVRRVMTPKEHVRWQRTRYESGPYIAVAADHWAKMTADDRTGHFVDFGRVPPDKKS